MNNTIKQMTNMKAALWVNAFIYYFKKLWVIGKLMPDSLYSNYRAKKMLNVIALVVRQVLEFLGKPFYLLIVAGIVFVMIGLGRLPFQGQEFDVLVHILFFLSCLTGAFGDSHIFNVSRDKITFIKYMHMNARSYIKSSLAFRYIPFFLYFLFWLCAAALFLGQPLWKGGCAWLMLLCFRMLGEALQLFVYDRTGKVLSRGMAYDWILIIAGLVGAYYPLFRGLVLPASLMLHPVTLVLYAAVGGACIYYITNGYKGYEKKLPNSLDLNFLLSNMLKTSSGASFKEVEIKDSDLDVSNPDRQKDCRHLHGYAYLNALFFARHRRQLLRPVYYRFLIAAALFAGGLFFYRSAPEAAVTLSQNLSASLLPSFVFIMYGITVADKACRAMFYNCDKDMLHYAYYRSPRTILNTFRARLFRVSLLNILVAAALCLAAIGFCLVCGTRIFTPDMLLFCITLILLAILFTAHHLCLYYIFQPYSESLKVKNPFFSGINLVMYALCFSCMRIKTGGPVFSMTVLVFTVAYILTVLVFVYYRAPKSFRVK